MARNVTYSVSPRINPREKDEAPKYYAHVQASGDIDVREMAICGGGAKSELWRQMLTDVYGISLHLRESSEGAVLGAAILGGCAAGVYASVEEGCARTVRNAGISTPTQKCTGNICAITRFTPLFTLP